MSMQADAIRVLIADDSPLFRRGIFVVLSTEEQIDVIAEAENGEEAIAKAEELAPDVVLMDVRMPGMDGIAATEAIVASGPDSKVLILTTFDLDQYVFAGLRAGASGFLLKDAPPIELLGAIRTVAGGDAVLAPTATRRLIDQCVPLMPHPDRKTRSDRLLDSFTDRERSVFAQLAAGRSNREIAAALYLSEGTVKIHVGRILAKLELRDRVQVVVLAYESGLITPGT